MAEIKFSKVTALPATLEANTLYFVVNGNYSETYVTNTAAVAKMVGNSTMIDERINALLPAAYRDASSG